MVTRYQLKSRGPFQLIWRTDQSQSAFAALAAKRRQVQQDLNLISIKEEKISSSPYTGASIEDYQPLENEKLIAGPSTILQLSTLRPDQIKIFNKTKLEILLQPGDVNIKKLFYVLQQVQALT